MAAQNITEYERRRLENIKRNDEMLTSLKIHSKLQEISTAVKRERTQSKRYKVSPTKKPRSETSTIIRRSLRVRGQPPDAATINGLKDDFVETPRKSINSKPFSKPFPPNLGPISMRDAYSSDDYDVELSEKILSASSNCESCFDEKLEVSKMIDLDLLKLKPENIARVLPNRILSMKFLPSIDMKMIVAGNNLGNVCFWDIDSDKKGDGIYLFRPHSAPVSGIAVQSFSQAKVFSSGYDGCVRLMDVEKEVFDLLYSSDDAIFSLGQQPNNQKSLYFGEGKGVVNVWDNNAGKSSNSWALHESRINTIDFNPANANVMATSSSDGTACIWDLRKMNKDKPRCIREVLHEKAVNSAYFSPSGGSLATISYDNKIGLSTGATFENITMISHYNHTGRWISPFRAIWSWDDSSLFVGNMRRGVDVISTEQKRTETTLQSPHLSAITCRFDIHPYHVGMLAGATSGGQIYIWTP
ncbi:WD repeat-containing protein 76 [Impatiens glandulifera]|uniref:WD repeat-containing protein 76 n=1 Tax=Impatiens glandulifera TaxID=253017 RepID=UPI001FB13932|nr:WD repeat-containing protein 76 [Impatiens glandulifera]